jgi:hypothetical protein
VHPDGKGWVDQNVTDKPLFFFSQY